MMAFETKDTPDKAPGRADLIYHCQLPAAEGVRQAARDALNARLILNGYGGARTRVRAQWPEGATYFF